MKFHRSYINITAHTACVWFILIIKIFIKGYPSLRDPSILTLNSQFVRQYTGCSLIIIVIKLNALIISYHEKNIVTLIATLGCQGLYLLTVTLPQAKKAAIPLSQLKRHQPCGRMANLAGQGAR